MAKFFVVVPLRFEDLALEELKQKIQVHGLVIDSVLLQSGGIEIETAESTGFFLNYVLKIPTRILLRMESFKVKDFTKFEKKLSQITWNNWCDYGQVVWKVESHGSRLFHKKNISKICERVFEKYRVGQPLKKQALSHVQNIFIRLVDDICQISVDTSGEALYKRGYKKFISKAPIRENIAAGLLWYLSESLNGSLFDPMCGSGTFLLEACQMHRPNFYRSYSFEFFRGVKKQRVQEMFQAEKEKGLKLFGADIDSVQIQNTRNNFLNIEYDGVELFSQDAFSIQGRNVDIVVVNPPYGERIKPIIAFTKLIQTLLKELNPHSLGIIVPKKYYLPNEKVGAYSLDKTLSFKNGGLAVKFLVFKITD
ncbi:MAG: N-6 DNA methylase [Bdellovibrionales bacterium]|nr:N-6 DNA methylase [Bdellovibrionales bacterium]